MPDFRPDLANLTRQATPTQPAKRLATWLLPLAILLGFAAVFLILFRDRLIPARRVEVSPALAVSTQNAAATATPSARPAAAPAALATGRLLFQASGWIEPAPQPIKVTALIDGFIDQVHVLEGADIKQGELLATLIDADARLARDAAAAEVTMLEADFSALGATRTATEHKLEGGRAGLAAAEADAAEAADRLRRLDQTASRAVPETERVTAQLENSRRQAGLRIRQALIDETSADLTRVAHEANAMTARIAGAKAKLAQAELDLARTRITSPINGRVLRLLAVPGQKKMAIMDDVDSSTVAIVYDPAALQARVDVPLADAAGLSVGQHVRIRCNLLPEQPFDGIVTRINGEADLQRNTLQAKVRLLQPSDRLRPEMLCRAEFFDSRETLPTTTASVAAPPTPLPATAELTIFIPENALVGSAVWICDPDTLRVSQRPVVATAEARDGYRSLESGVRPGEWVVRSPSDLREGQRVKPTTVP